MTKIINPLDDTLYVSAQEAATLLGVTRSTLYAYVSRRGIRSVPVTGKRERLYWRSDIERARTARGRPPAEREPRAVPESSISLIGADGLYYRGQSAVTLAERSELEDVAALLWSDDRERLFADRRPVFPDTARAIAGILSSAPGLARAAALLPIIEDANPRSFDFSPQGMGLTGADVVRSLTAVMLGQVETSTDPIHEQIARHYGLADEWREFVRALLVLSADHGFEPSSYAVRSVAGIGVSPYRSVTAGLLLIAGRRTLLGRIDAVERLLGDIDDGGGEAAIVARLKGDGEVPGFGFHAYVNGDPRAKALLERLAAMMGDAPALAKLRQAMAIVADALGQHPDFALVMQFAARQFMGERRESLFIIGRSVGWIAHSIEQSRTGRAIRPQSIYTGPLPES